MPDYFVSACSLSGIEFSQINIVRAFNSGQTSRASTEENTTMSNSINWFRNNAAARRFSSLTTSVSASEFRTAQVLTACISTTTESYKYYYANCNNGKICVCVNPDTVVSNTGLGATSKIYQYSKDNGANYVVCTNDNTHVFTGVDGGGNQSCGRFLPGAATSQGGSFANYPMIIKDGCSQAVIQKTVQVTYNSTGRSYDKVQSQDNTAK
jgi:hypothetical protein